MSTEAQRVQKQTAPSSASPTTALSPEDGGFDFPQALPAQQMPPAVMTARQVKRMQRTVGNRATLSRLPISSTPHTQVQRQDDDPVAAVRAAISATTRAGIHTLLAILGDLHGAANGGTVAVNAGGVPHAVPEANVTELVDAGKEHLTGLVVDAVNTLEAPALSQFLRRIGAIYAASGAGANTAGLTQVSLASGTPLQLTGEQTSAISAAADAKVVPSMLSFAAARIQKMRKLRELENALSTIPPQFRELALPWYDAHRREIMETLRASDEVWLDSTRPLAELRLMRWAHPNPVVQDTILAALQMQAVESAEGALDNVGDDQNSIDNAIANDAREIAGFGRDNNKTSNDEPHWCGAFAMLNMQAGGWDQDLSMAFCHTDNVMAFFNYNLSANPGRLMPWIFDPIELWWDETPNYHQSRGSRRQGQNVGSVADLNEFAGSGPRAGDVVVSEGGDRHIAMVQSWDPVTRVLFLIDGNANGYRVRPPGEPDDATNESPQERRAEATTGRDLEPSSGQRHVGVRVNDYGNNQTELNIIFIGRPSIVDFEEHHYRSIEPPPAPTTS